MTDEIQISERELHGMVSDLDDMHRAVMPGVWEHVSGMAERMREVTGRHSVNRRTFLMGSGLAAGGLALAACSSSTGSSAAKPGASAGTNYSGDLKVVALAAALENLGVAAYQMALTAAGKGTYGTVPPAVARFVTTAMGQHEEHAAAWNSVLTKNNLKAVTDIPLTIKDAQVSMVQAAKTLPDVAKVALGVENAAASTYLEAIGAVKDAGGIMVAATIAPVEAQHAAVLHYVLGEYPVPDSFIKMDAAVKPDAFTG